MCIRDSAVFRGVHAEILGRVVAFAGSHAGAGNAGQLYLNRPPPSVARGIRRVVAHQVITGGIVLHRVERFAQIAEDEKRLPSRVFNVCRELSRAPLCWKTAAPVNAPVPLALAWLAFPPGASAISPRASTV